MEKQTPDINARHQNIYQSDEEENVSSEEESYSKKVKELDKQTQLQESVDMKKLNNYNASRGSFECQVETRYSLSGTPTQKVIKFGNETLILLSESQKIGCFEISEAKTMKYYKNKRLFSRISLSSKFRVDDRKYFIYQKFILLTFFEDQFLVLNLRNFELTQIKLQDEFIFDMQVAKIGAKLSIILSKAGTQLALLSSDFQSLKFDERKYLTENELHGIQQYKEDICLGVLYNKRKSGQKFAGAQIGIGIIDFGKKTERVIYVHSFEIRFLHWQDPLKDILIFKNGYYDWMIIDFVTGECTGLSPFRFQEESYRAKYTLSVLP